MLLRAGRFTFTDRPFVGTDPLDRGEIVSLDRIAQVAVEAFQQRILAMFQEPAG